MYSKMLPYIIYVRESMTSLLVSFFLFLSGMSALIYQVIWVRLLSLSIGASSISISIVLAAFFLGLGLGSYFVGDILKRFKKRFKVYLFIEFFIAVSALVLLPVLLHLDYFISLLPFVEVGIGFRFFIVMLLLIIPTFLIGTTFALLMAVIITQQKDIAGKLAHFYALNTLGAVCGALLSGIVLIPDFGLDGAVYIAATFNIAIVIIGVIFYRYFDSIQVTYNHDSPLSNDFKPNNKALVILFVSGVSAMATEVGWMKFLIVYTGNTIYGFSLILAMFLTGLTIGSYIVKHSFISKIASEKILFYGLILLAMALVFARIGLAMFPEIYAQLNDIQTNAFISRWSKYAVMFLVLLPATTLFGALFPIALRLYSNELEMLHSKLGVAYAINTIAGIVGSLVAGFFLIPYFSTDTLLLVMAFIVLMASSVFFKEMGFKKAFSIWLIACIGIYVGAKYLAHIDYASMIDIVVKRNVMSANTPSRVEFLKEGHTGIISVLSELDDPCIMILLNNGLSESWVDRCDRNNLLLSEFLLGELAVLLNPLAEKAFVIGYGAGTTVQALSMNQQLKSIDVVELEPVVLDAVSFIYGGKLPTGDDPRVTVTINDARNTLLLSKNKYDIIASQPSHPWLSGASNVMNKDFFEIIKSRLSPGGIDAQWVPLFTIDVATLKSIIKAYTDTFAYVISFVNLQTRDFMMFGSNKAIVYDYSAVQQLMKNDRVKRVLSKHGINNPNDLLDYFALTREQLVTISKNALPATDTNLLAETFYGRYKDIPNNSFDTLGYIKSFMKSDIK